LVPGVRLEGPGLGVGIEVGALIGPGRRVCTAPTASGPGSIVANKVSGAGLSPLLVVAVVAGVVVARAGAGVGSGTGGLGLLMVDFDDG